MPGGSIDAGETLESGALREIIEETGIIRREFLGIVIYPIDGRYYCHQKPCRIIPFYLYESAFHERDYVSTLK